MAKNKGLFGPVSRKSGSDRVLALNELDARIFLHQLSLGSIRYRSRFWIEWRLN